MKFRDRLLQGTFVKRYKRFFVDIKLKNKIITAHCPNTGSMLGLTSQGNKAWLSKSNNPNRKLKYTLEMIKVDNELIGINTLLTNRLVHEALSLKKIKSLAKYNNIRTEVKFSSNTRFDFLISNSNEKCFLEVKNVTLERNNKIAEFPDAVTDRGTKHLFELISTKEKGFDCCILYLIQRQDCKNFKIAENIDANYKMAFDKAIKAGVRVLCYDCKINNEEIKLNNLIKLI